MKRRNSHTLILLALLTLWLAPAVARAQGDAPVILSGAQLARIVPPGFFFEGQSAPTQMRNSAAARFSGRHHVVAGLVDTSGYSADVRSRYEGFLIVDTPVMIGGQELATGAYGFGFVENNKFSVSDVGGNLIFNIETEPDRNLRRPRPLMMTRGAGGVRLYSGRRYVTISLRR
ncbi:MAG TPA: hypothetical protein VJ842_00525 [Pyrinomonadaceae bacterium]|nr:hypothetical protein [Pyrinomonadaceae bacterium]